MKLVPLVDRSKIKPVSIVELSCHVRLTRFEEVAAAINPEGAAGIPAPPPLSLPLLMVTLSKLAMQTMPSLWLVTASPSESDDALPIVTVAVPTCVQLTPSGDR